MKKVLIALSVIISLTACHESLEKRAAREAKEYTERCCPTPVLNNVRTDSMAFNTENKEFVYYYSFMNELDNEAVILQNKQAFHDTLRDMVASDVNLKPYVEAGFRFTYIYRSGSNPEKVLFQDSFKREQQNTSAKGE